MSSFSLIFSHGGELLGLSRFLSTGSKIAPVQNADWNHDDQRQVDQPEVPAS